MDERCLVSVLIRTKNRPHLLPQAIASVASQDFPELELIVVNDGGECVNDILKPFEASFKRIIYIEHEACIGRPLAANTALSHASGEYCIFLDDDDLFEPDHISALVNAIASDRLSRRAAYAGVRGENTFAGVVFNSPWDPGRLWAENYLPIHSVLFGREIAQHCRFDERLSVYEDWDFWLQLARQTAFIHVDQISAVYRSLGNSAAGLGNTDANLALSARKKIYAKWVSHWQGEEVAQIVDALNARTREVDVELKRLSTEHAELRRQHREILTSTSWRLTAPLRWFMTHLRNLIG